MEHEVMEELEKWVGSETWYTSGDVERFYSFVNCLSKFNLNKLDEFFLWDNIKRSVLKFHPEFNFEEDDELLIEFTHKIAIIFDYLEFVDKLNV